MREQRWPNFASLEKNLRQTVFIILSIDHIYACVDDNTCFIYIKVSNKAKLCFKNVFVECNI